MKWRAISLSPFQLSILNSSMLSILSALFRTVNLAASFLRQPARSYPQVHYLERVLSP